jgi:hypothetical protein
VEPGYRGSGAWSRATEEKAGLQRKKPGVEPGYRGKLRRGVEPGYRGKEENHNHPHLTGLLNIFCHIV